jgi:hypothetical protein
MDKYDIQDEEIYKYNISLYEYPLEVTDAFCMRFEKKDYICINKNKNFSRLRKYWIVEHELEHIKQDAFYACENKKIAIQRRERKANDALILKHGLVTPVLDCLKHGLDKWEICDYYEIPFDLFDHILDYIKRKELK